MDEIGLFEAKNKLSELVNRDERGEEVVITRRGKAVRSSDLLATCQDNSNRDRPHSVSASERFRPRKTPCYLELAQWRELPLATLDNDLRKAAKALDIPLLGV